MRSGKGDLREKRCAKTPPTRPPLFSAIVVAFFLLCAISLLGCGNPEKQKVKHHRKGLILARRGRHIEAVAEYQKALKIDPDMAEVHYDLGRSYAGLQYHDRAVRALGAA